LASKTSEYFRVLAFCSSLCIGALSVYSAFSFASSGVAKLWVENGANKTALAITIESKRLIGLIKSV
jgi:hypothetical protein